jgi:hypothetical protein
MNLSAHDAPAARTSGDLANLIRRQMPPDGLFRGQEWRISPNPFPLGPELAKEIETLGRVLLQFLKALNQLYRQSVNGKLPPWPAQWLDQGKPAALVELQRELAFKNELPRVIRPDLLFTEQGLALTELDSVPGGIGLTAWLNQTYSALPDAKPVLGGNDGMIRGFAGIFGDAPKVHIVVSDESDSYRPEMEWLCHQLPEGRFAVRAPNFTEFADGDAVYRFFELFDLANVPASGEIFARAKEKKLFVTPPPRPVFEEKLALALLWNRNLASFWRQELGEAFFKRMLRLTPYSWVMDPAPLPPHGAIPGLEITDWQQLKALSQKERELIIKISGYSENAWGARGVHLGSDLSQADWSAAVDAAIRDFPRSPHVLQRYHKPALVNFAWHDFERDMLTPMPGRVRLCPYYFVHGESDSARPQLGGALATVNPADKKIIHGMRDAILAPCSA